MREIVPVKAIGVQSYVSRPTHALPSFRSLIKRTFTSHRSRIQTPDSTRTAPLRAELLSIAQELPAPPSFDPTAESGGKEEGTADVEGEGDEQESRGKTLMSSSKGGTKVPKWLKSVSSESKGLPTIRVCGVLEGAGCRSVTR